MPAISLHLSITIDQALKNGGTEAGACLVLLENLKTKFTAAQQLEIRPYLSIEPKHDHLLRVEDKSEGAIIKALDTLVIKRRTALSWANRILETPDAALPDATDTDEDTAYSYSYPSYLGSEEAVTLAFARLREIRKQRVFVRVAAKWTSDARVKLTDVLAPPTHAERPEWFPKGVWLDYVEMRDAWHAERKQAESDARARKLEAERVVAAAEHALLEERGSQNQIERWQEGLLPEEELLHLARMVLFAPLEQFGRWQKLQAISLTHHVNCSEIAPIRWDARDAEALTADQWRNFKAIELVIEREGIAGFVQLRDHLGGCPECDAKIRGASAKVTIQWAGRDLVREYTLDAAPKAT